MNQTHPQSSCDCRYNKHIHVYNSNILNLKAYSISRYSNGEYTEDTDSEKDSDEEEPSDTEEEEDTPAPDSSDNEAEPGPMDFDSDASVYDEFADTDA